MAYISLLIHCHFTHPQRSSCPHVILSTKSWGLKPEIIKLPVKNTGCPYFSALRL